MSDPSEVWVASLEPLQTVVLAARPLETILGEKDTRTLYRSIVRRLTRLYDEGHLAEPQETIRKLVRQTASQHTERAEEVAVCSPKNFKRDHAKPHLTRTCDNAWFDFGVTVRAGSEGLQLLAYDFEIRDLAGTQLWVRFDLNPPRHTNENRMLRSHLHPGTDDWMVPSPVYHPIELIDLLVLGMRSNRKSARAL